MALENISRILQSFPWSVPMELKFDRFVCNSVSPAVPVCKDSKEDILPVMKNASVHCALQGRRQDP